MSKCKQCGEELVWVGSMLDGKLECPNCLALALWSDAGSEDIIDPGFDPDSVTVVTAPDPAAKFWYVDPNKTIVRCPFCAGLGYARFMNLKHGKSQCNNCGVWSEIEK